MPVDIIEMFWGCTICNAENKGRFKTCQNCGKPRTENCPEWLPGDISPMAAVKDPELLRKFKAGADWKCRYCSSSQFRADGNCAQCGSSQGDSTPIRDSFHEDLCKEEFKKPVTTGNIHTETIPKVVHRIPDPEPPPFINEPSGYREPARRADNFDQVLQERVADAVDRASYPKIPKAPRWRPPPQLFIGAAIIAALALVFYFIFRTKVVDTTVTAVSWERSVKVERYQVYSHEGWYPGGGAFNVRDLGSRIHHYDHVQVGSHSESYLASYPCGETCTTISGSCYTTPRSCTSNKNGSATCTGGDRVCSPDTKSCLPKTCTETRQRTVPDYEDQPRYQEWYAWEAWEWGHHRTPRVVGSTTDTYWPSEQQIALNVGLRPGEAEREAGRFESYSVTLKGEEPYTYTPHSDEEFKRFQLGSHRRIKVGVAHGVEILSDR